jgi:hypothetical protein
MALNSFRKRVLNVGEINTQGQGELMVFDVYSVQYVCMKLLTLQTKEFTVESRL